MSMFQRDPRAGVFLGGDRVSGQDIRDQNGACGDDNLNMYAKALHVKLWLHNPLRIS